MSTIEEFLAFKSLRDMTLEECHGELANRKSWLNVNKRSYTPEEEEKPSVSYSTNEDVVRQEIIERVERRVRDLETAIALRGRKKAERTLIQSAPSPDTAVAPILPSSTPTEASAAKQEEGDDRAPLPPKRRHGPLPAMEIHRKIEGVVKKYGGKWREEATMEEIVAQLDRENVPIREKWSLWKRRTRIWKRAFDYYPNRVRQAIDYSLKMASRDTSD